LLREGVAALPPFAALLALQQSPEPAPNVATVSALAETPERPVETVSTLVRPEPLFRQMFGSFASLP